MRDIDEIALVAWITCMAIGAAIWLYGHSPIGAIGMIVSVGGLVFSSVAAICVAIRELKS